jgi:hypothetical protein
MEQSADQAIERLELDVLGGEGVECTGQRGGVAFTGDDTHANLVQEPVFELRGEYARH